jgi:hypothetical protein
MNTVVKKEEKKDGKIIYPDQLNITIRTSVPGYQKIQYKPSMTIKNSYEKAVKFNPLIKLNKSKINTIPEEYRIKEFFNKGLFQSLLNYNGGIPAKSLVQATRYGYVDNNIKVTLDSIFPVGSVIYIGKNPYAIGDIQWTTSDWKIEIKQKREEIDPSKITDPKLYTQLVKEEIISGEEQLNQIPAVILTGVNYTGPPPAAATQAGPPIAAAPPAVPPPAVPPPAVPPQAVPPQAVPPQAVPPQAGPLVVRPSQAAPPQAVPPQAGPLVVRPPQAVPPQAAATQAGPLVVGPPQAGPLVVRPPQAGPPPSNVPLLLPPQQNVEELSPEEERLYDSFKKDLKISILNSSFFRKYFQSNKYFELMKIIFNYFPSLVKSNIRNFYYITTNSIPKKPSVLLNKSSYDKLCEQVTILQSPTDGDCFFKAVADGININNYENQNSKIVYNNYGINNLFTIKVLREIVFRYIRQLDVEIVNNMLLLAEVSKELLNNKFRQSAEETERAFNLELTDEQYLDVINNIYYSDTNFLIKKPERVPRERDLYYTPFEVVTNLEIERYILSKNYWANDIAIDAICDILKISIIPIEKYDYQTTVRVSIKIVDRLKALISNNKLIKDECSKKIMFLFYKNNHYELIRFKYFVKPITKIIGQGIREQKQVQYVSKWFTIFNNNDLAPPIHILLLIYGTAYSSIIDIESKNEFSIYLPIMKQIDTTCKKILYSYKKDVFIQLFNNLFPNRRPIQSRLIQEESMIYNPDAFTSNQLLLKNPEEEEENLEESMITRRAPNLNDEIDETVYMVGGQYRYPPSYRYPRPGHITKKPEDSDSSKIAYSITIDMELHPGTSLTPQQISESKCNTKYNAIRKAFAEFTGKPYVIPPVYPKTKNNTKKNIIQSKGGKRKTRKNIQ